MLENIRRKVALAINPSLAKQKKVERFLQADPNRMHLIPKYYRRQVGRLRAELAKKNKEIEKLRDQMEIKQLVNVTQELALQDAYIKNKQKKQLMALAEAKNKNVTVISKDGIRLGYLYDFAVSGGESPAFAIICSSRPGGQGRRYKVMSHTSIVGLVHNAHTMQHQLRNGYLMLNRLYDGTVAEDLEVPLGAIQPGMDGETVARLTVEQALAQKNKVIGQLYGRLEQAEKREAKELNTIKDLEMMAEKRKHRADAAVASQQVVHDALNTQLEETYNTQIENAQARQRERYSDKLLSTQESHIEALRKKMLELYDKSEIEQAREDVLETAKEFKMLDLKPETTKPSTLEEKGGKK